MKRGMVLFLTLVLTAAMAVTTANAQQYVHTDTLRVPLGRMTGNLSPVRGIGFKDNETLIGMFWDRSIGAWDVTTGTRHWQKEIILAGQKNESIGLDLSVSGDDPLYVAYAGGDDSKLVLISVFEEHDSRIIVGAHTKGVYSVAFKPNSHLLASGSADNTIRIWNFRKPRLHPQYMRTLEGHRGSVNSVAWSPDGRTLASASRDGTVRLWDPVLEINFAVLRGHRSSVTCVAWSPDGRILASGSDDKTVRLWDPDTDTIRHVLQGHTNRVNELAFHPDGETLASASWIEQTIRLWNPNTGTLKATLTGKYPLAFSPNGQILACGGTFTDLYHPVRTTPAEIYLYRWLTVDVTGNGSVTVSDLHEVARNYASTVGARGVNRKADVNGDGKIDFKDVLAVLTSVDAAFAAGEDVSLEEEPTEPVDLPTEDTTNGDVDTADGDVDTAEEIWEGEGDQAGAPAIGPGSIGTGMSLLRVADVRRWIRDAKAANAEPAGIAALERLLAALTRVEAPPPKETVLLANYPNPFNPETWIPYQLSDPAEVTVSIYALDGKLVRTLELGQMPAGVYQIRSRAAYWDGRNAQGEPVASGVYFYTLRAGDFSATRKMVIRK